MQRHDGGDDVVDARPVRHGDVVGADAGALTARCEVENADAGHRSGIRPTWCSGNSGVRVPLMRIALLFPGQGSQAVGMGKALADAIPAVKRVFEEADDALGEKLST